MWGSAEVDETGEQVLQGLVVRTAVQLPVGSPRDLSVVVVELRVVNVLQVYIHLSLRSCARFYTRQLMHIPGTQTGYYATLTDVV